MRILGGSEIVEGVLRQSDEGWDRRSLLRQRAVDLRRLQEKIAGHFDLDTADLKSRSKARNIAKPRALLCYVGVHKLGLTYVSIAKELGISPSVVSKSMVQGRQYSTKISRNTYWKVNKSRMSPFLKFPGRKLFERFGLKGTRFMRIPAFTGGEYKLNTVS